MDQQILEDQIKGLEAKGKELRVKEGLFLEALGLDKQIESAAVAVDELEEKLRNTKNTLDELKAQKSKAVAKTIDALAAKLNEALPEGKAVFTIEDSNVFLGWEVDGKVKPLHGLSGGERIIFEGALCHALKAELIIYEAAEVQGFDRLPALLSRAAELDQQVIVNTWFVPRDVPEPWKVVTLD